MYDWNDLRYFVACHRAGSLTRAAQELGVALSTVSRRLAALETSLGAPLFLRLNEGLELTAAGEAILSEAEEVQARTASVQDRLAKLSGVPEGCVRVTLAGGDLLSLVLFGCLQPLLDRYPGLQVEFDSGIDLSDMVRREADIAVRTSRPTQGGDELICLKARDESFSAYAATRYLDRVGRGRPPQEYGWIGADRERDGLPGNQALLSLAGRPPRLRLTSQSATRAAVARGLGCSVLSDTFGALTPGIEPVPGLPQPLYTVPLYLLCHRGLRHVPRVAAVWEWLRIELANSDGELELLRSRLHP